MKYAIYDKAADGYLTKLEFENDVPVQTLGLICGYNEYITEAKLLDTKEEAVAVVTSIESNKFMEKGRFVIHSFDDTLKEQYIISEAGTPTKVIDSITVDLDGTINVKYGTMACHWSTASLDYAITRMNALQKAKSPIYTAWCNTFYIYKVIRVIDERSCGHYQFINVTTKGLEEYAKNEEEKLLVAGNEIVNATTLLNKRIEELEKANYDLGEQVTARGIIANRLQEENDKLKAKVESIKKEAHDWKNLYKKADRERDALKNVIDNIYDDLHSDNMHKDLKDTYDYVHNFSELHDIKIHNDDDDTGMPIYITANVEFRCIIDKIIAIIESRELSKKYCGYASKAIANNIVDICKADGEFNITLKKFSELYEAVNAVYNTDNDLIIHAFKSILLIFSTMDSELENFAAEIVGCKNKAQKAEKALDDQKKLNDSNKATIAQMVVVKRAMNKEIKELRDTRGSIAEVMFAIRNAIYNNDSDAFDCIESRMIHDSDFNSSPFMAGVRENIKDICAAEKRNIANHELKNGEIARLANEKERALERAEFYKRMANSIYGISISGRCCGKQMTADVITGKKILVDKKKYDDLIECVNNISLTYEMMKPIPFSMDRPSWLSGIINRINDLTK